jgi:hypothetical protein
VVLKIQGDRVQCPDFESSSELGGRRRTGFVMRDGGERWIGARRYIAIVRLQQVQVVLMNRRAVMWLDGGSALKLVSSPIQIVKCA